MALQTANLSASTLNGGINNSVTSLDVTSAASFPASGDFWIRIDDELLKVTGVSSNTFTVVRGESGGGAAASHSNGATVTGVLTSQSITQLRADITRQGTHAQMAALTDMKSGDTFHFDGTDTPYDKAIYNGSSWNLYYRGYKCTPMVIGDYSADSGSDTLSAYGGAAKLTIPNDGGDRCRGTLKALPSAPYVITMLAIVPGASGLCLHQNSTSEFHYLQYLGGHATLTWRARQFASPTSAGSTYATHAVPPFTSQVAFFRIADNSTNRITSYATFGGPFHQLHSVANTDFLTPDLFGPATSNAYGFEQYMIILSMEIA